MVCLLLTIAWLCTLRQDKVLSLDVKSEVNP